MRRSPPLIAGVQQQFPGHRFELSFGPDAHNDRVRFAWRLLGASGEPVAAGVDFGTLSDDGRLQLGDRLPGAGGRLGPA